MLIERKNGPLEAVEPFGTLVRRPRHDPEVQLFALGFRALRDLNAVCHASDASGQTLAAPASCDPPSLTRWAEKSVQSVVNTDVQSSSSANATNVACEKPNPLHATQLSSATTNCAPDPESSSESSRDGPRWIRPAPSGTPFVACHIGVRDRDAGALRIRSIEQLYRFREPSCRPRFLMSP